MTPSQSDKAVRFRALHRGPGAFLMPNPWDAGSALGAEAAVEYALADPKAGGRAN